VAEEGWQRAEAEAASHGPVQSNLKGARIHNGRVWGGLKRRLIFVLDEQMLRHCFRFCSLLLLLLSMDGKRLGQCKRPNRTCGFHLRPPRRPPLARAWHYCGLLRYEYLLDRNRVRSLRLSHARRVVGSSQSVAYAGLSAHALHRHRSAAKAKSEALEAAVQEAAVRRRRAVRR